MCSIVYINDINDHIKCFYSKDLSHLQLSVNNDTVVII